ncbi:hypothetical protein EVAR_74886_1 [Eumeta japonica]|uniref:Uncharacterized protein n=1 Tax=Eumeta variegata TaxID=151549 RepID=A0A4C1Z3K3_EUMVA|nr:hypothetical protein EVAR_74886_1 [Eumeta japonica]
MFIRVHRLIFNGLALVRHPDRIVRVCLAFDQFFNIAPVQIQLGERKPSRYVPTIAGSAGDVDECAAEQPAPPAPGPGDRNSLLCTVFRNTSSCRRDGRVTRPEINLVTGGSGRLN